MEIVLVHGTFARNAAWADPEHSPLCAYLKKSLRCPVVFTRFQWSGWNTFSAREKAAENLASILLATPKRGSRFVIAHSHGGSVVARTLSKSVEVAETVDGVVFLSTPFIQGKSRANATALDYLIEASLVTLYRLFTFIAFLVALLVQNGTALLAVTAAWLVAKEAVGRLSGQSVFHNLWIRMKDFYSPEVPASEPLPVWRKPRLAVISTARLLDQLKVTIDPSRCLILRTTADEASMGLSSAQMVSFVAGLVLSTLLRIAALLAPAVFLVGYEGRSPDERDETARSSSSHLYARQRGLIGAIARTGLKLTALAAVGLELFQFAKMVAVYSGKQIDVSSPGILIFLSVVSIPLVWVLAIAVLYVPPLLLVYMLLLVSTAAFGGSAAYGILFVELSTEATPPGAWTILQFQSSNRDDEFAFALAHSQSYESRDALKAISDWILVRNASC